MCSGVVRRRLRVTRTRHGGVGQTLSLGLHRNYLQPTRFGDRYVHRYGEIKHFPIIRSIVVVIMSELTQKPKAHDTRSGNQLHKSVPCGLFSTPDSGASFSCRRTTSDVIDCLRGPKAVNDVRTSDVIDCLRAPKAVNDVRSCLLYTSPSPRDGLLSRMPSSA